MTLRNSVLVLHDCPCIPVGIAISLRPRGASDLVGGLRLRGASATILTGLGLRGASATILTGLELRGASAIILTGLGLRGTSAIILTGLELRGATAIIAIALGGLGGIIAQVQLSAATACTP
eukprot:g290.t1